MVGGGVRLRVSNVIRLIIFLVKFVAMMFIMTIACTLAWDAFLNGKVYSCTDGGSLDYLNVGGWVHAHGGYPIVVVHQIGPPDDMGDPDTIKEGWSVTGLWCIWFLLFGVSLVVSIVFACVSWIAKIDRLAERIHGPTNAA